MIEGNFNIKSKFSFSKIDSLSVYRDDRDRNDEIQQLIARAESNARQYMSNFNITTTYSGQNEI